MPTRVILIGGSSHSGKSALAGVIGARLGWRHVSTDSLAWHPGRPWAVPLGPAERFRSLAVEDLIVDVQAHYQRLWPQIEALITTGDNLVLEGSALWPDRVARLALGDPQVRAGWLTTTPEHFRKRIYAESNYADVDARLRVLVDTFLARTVRYDELMMDVVKRCGLVSINVGDTTVDELAGRFLAAVGF